MFFLFNNKQIADTEFLKIVYSYTRRQHNLMYMNQISSNKYTAFFSSGHL